MRSRFRRSLSSVMGPGFRDKGQGFLGLSFRFPASSCHVCQSCFSSLLPSAVYDELSSVQRFPQPMNLLLWPSASALVARALSPVICTLWCRPGHTPDPFLRVRWLNSRLGLHGVLPTPPPLVGFLKKRSQNLATRWAECGDVLCNCPSQRPLPWFFIRKIGCL